jgi:adenosylmethionine-8-amino-7-oxononanoate aminotransferase
VTNDLHDPKAAMSLRQGDSATRLVGDTPAGGSVLDFYLPAGTPRPPRISRGDGVELFDDTGRSWMDITSGAVVCNLGHAHPRVVEAMVRQARRVAYAYPMFFESDDNVALADLVCRLAGPGFERAFFVSGGSEANEAAFKLARQYAVARGQGTRWKIISREPSYHGATLGAQGATGDAAAEALFGPMMRVAPKVPAPLSYRVPAGTTVAEHAAACACALEARILAEGADTVLAFIMEPVGGVATGALVAPEAYYQQVRRICSRHGVLLIHDEVMSGAGRTGRFLASRHFTDASPDIVTLAKGLAAGYTPFGAVLVRGEIVDTLVRAGGFAHGHTYVANPFSCAVARAVLETVVDEGLVERAAELGERLRQGLLELQSRVALIGDVRGLGLLQAIELVADRSTRRSLPVTINAPARLSAHGFAHGLALYHRRANAGAYGDFLLIAPPLISTPAQIDEMVSRLGLAVQDLQRELQGQGHLAAMPPG